MSSGVRRPMRPEHPREKDEDEDEDEDEADDDEEEEEEGEEEDEGGEARAEDYEHPLGRRKKKREKEKSAAGGGTIEVNAAAATAAASAAAAAAATAPPRKSIRWGHVELRAEEIVGGADSQKGSSRWRHRKRRMSSFEDERAMLRKAGPPSKIQMLKNIRKIRRAALKAETLERQNATGRGGRSAQYQRLLGLALLAVVVVFFVHHSCDTWIESLTVTVIAFVVAFGCVL